MLYVFQTGSGGTFSVSSFFSFVVQKLTRPSQNFYGNSPKILQVHCRGTHEKDAPFQFWLRSVRKIQCSDVQKNRTWAVESSRRYDCYGRGGAGIFRFHGGGSVPSALACVLFRKPTQSIINMCAQEGRYQRPWRCRSSASHKP
jgi:hypothetical protein